MAERGEGLEQRAVCKCFLAPTGELGEVGLPFGGGDKWEVCWESVLGEKRRGVAC